jgi:transcriptional regulator with XRE-family HTH domain
MVPSVESDFVRAVKRAFADALLVEIRRTRLGRDDAAAAGGVSRSFLQFLLAAEQQPKLSTLISLAEGLGIRPEELFVKTMEHLDRIRPALTDPEQVSDPES